MRVPLVCYFSVGLAISSVSGAPTPQDPTTSRPASDFGDILPVDQPAVNQGSSFGTKLSNLALASSGAALLGGAAIGISEWALNWYNRFLINRNSRNHQNQSLQDERYRRQEQISRRERAMDIVLDIAEKYSDEVASRPDFDGNFEPLTVPSGISGAVHNVFEQTIDLEDANASDMGSLEGLKEALKPVMNFRADDEKHSLL
jgi:hypothetical protein